MYNYNTIIKDFLQYKRYLGYKYNTEETVLNEISTYLTNNNINIITKEVTEKYARVNPNTKSNTIARNMGVLREFCKYLELQGIECYQIPNNIYPQNHKFIPYIFSKEEINLIYKNLYFINNNYHYDYYRRTIYPLIIKILYQTGMRIGEVLNLEFDDYNIEYQYFHIRDSKNDEERLVVLPDDLNKEFIEFYNKFKHLNGRMFKITKSTINHYFNEVLKLSKINKTDKVRLHNLRHTFVVHTIKKFLSEGKDINVVLPILEKYLGHKSIEALSYYFHMTKDILNDISKLSEDKLSYLIPELEGDIDE